MGIDAGYGIGSLKPGVCTSTTRPTNPYTGQTIFETDTNKMKVWLGSAWSTGTAHAAGLNVEYLVVAGGGCGRNTHGGGGGAGGYRSSVAGESSGGGSSAESPLILTPGSYTVTIGAGGADRYTQGSNSVFHTITSIGGGTGDASSGAGGSGAGGGGGAGTGGSGTSTQGYSGANGTITSGIYTGGGGGGAGAAGSGRQGGVGVSSSINGTATFRAGGGSGGQDYQSSTTLNGGNGGGGRGGAGNTAGVSGTANTGGGGGGGGQNSGDAPGQGGSGIVIVRYLTADASAFSISGGTKTTNGDYTIHTFTGSGSLSIS